MSKKSKSCEIRKNPRFSKLKSKVLDILVQARDIVRDKRYWTHGEWGVDRNGLPAATSKSVGTDYNKACRVCAEGAIACSARTYEQYGTRSTMLTKSYRKTPASDIPHHTVSQRQ
jgi:hypothetical protein